MLKRLPLCLICWLGLLHPSIAQTPAKTPRPYEVELIVFVQPQSVAAEAQRVTAGNEINPNAKSLPSPMQERWDFSPSRMDANWQRMAELAAQATPQPTSKKLVYLEVPQRHLLKAGYRIITTAKWQQLGIPFKEAPLITLKKSFITKPSKLLQQSLKSAPTTDTDTQSRYDKINTHLNGFVRVYATHLIYADVDLQLSPPSFWADTSASSLNPNAPAQQPHFFISEKRRIKFRQIHYFDHPRFGALLTVWAADDDPRNENPYYQYPSLYPWFSR